MIQTLYAIYSFVTDLPDMIDVVSVFLWIGVVAHCVITVQQKTAHKALHWLAGIAAFGGVGAGYYGAWLLIGLPSWMAFLPILPKA